MCGVFVVVRLSHRRWSVAYASATNGGVACFELVGEATASKFDAVQGARERNERAHGTSKVIT